MAEKKTPAKKIASGEKGAAKKGRKKCRSKSASIKHNLIDTRPGDISRIVWQSARFLGRECVKTDEECAERLNEYFRECYDLNIIPTVEDMALALGTHREVIWRWEQKGGVRGHMIRQAKQILAGIDAALAAEGKIPQVVYIFRSKNFYGMRDQQEVMLAPANPMGDAQSAEQLRKKYMEDTYGLIEEGRTVELEQGAEPMAERSVDVKKDPAPQKIEGEG